MSETRSEDMSPVQMQGIEHILASPLWKEDLAEEPLGKWPDEDTFTKFFVGFTADDLRCPPGDENLATSEDQEVWAFAHQAMERLIEEDVLPDADISQVTIKEVLRRFCKRYGISAETARDAVEERS